MTDWDALYAGRMAGVVGSDIRERMKLLSSPDIIHLGGGLPDPDLYPYAALAAAADRVWRDRRRARTALDYAPSEGHGPLRDWIAADLTRRGAPCGVDNIVIVNGSQQGLDIVGKLFLSPGDRVVVELPSFIGALRAFDAYQPVYAGLPADPGRWDDAGLAGARFCYAGPDFRNPTGTTLTRGERERLLDLAARTGMALVEDGCYERLRYDGVPVPSLFALGIARHGGVERSPVIHAGTFSKTVAPSLRVGWLAGPAAVMRKVALIKQASDLATSALNQMLVLDIAEGHLDAAVAAACALYRDRRDAMLAALADHMPPGVHWTRPDGGLYLWLDLPHGVDGGDLARRALAEHGVVTIAGAAFYPAGVAARRNTLRLSFSMAPADRAREGIARLGRLVAALAGA